jgi:hypothetical protein
MSRIVMTILILCAPLHISMYISGHMHKTSVHKRRPFTNLLSRNIVPFEMSDGVGKKSRVIYFKLFSVSFFQKRAPTFSTNPDSVCVLWPKPLSPAVLNTERYLPKCSRSRPVPRKANTLRYGHLSMLI